MTSPTGSPFRRISSPPCAIGVSGDERDKAEQPPRGRLAFRGDQRVAADEIALVEPHRETEPRLVRVVVRRQFPAPRAIAFLQPQRLDGVVAGIARAEARARLHQRVVDAAAYSAGTKSSQPSSPT